MPENSSDTYNKGGLFAFLATMAVTLGFMLYISFLHPGVSYDQVRPRDAGGVKLAMFDPSSVEKSWISSQEMIDFGAKKYKSSCATCHGATGLGNGPGAAGLNPPPRNLVTGNWEHGGDMIGLHKSIAKGISGSAMAAYENVFSPAEIWAIVHFINSITKNKVGGEEAAMEAYTKSL